MHEDFVVTCPNGPVQTSPCYLYRAFDAALPAAGAGGGAGAQGHPGRASDHLGPRRRRRSPDGSGPFRPPQPTGTLDPVQRTATGQVRVAEIQTIVTTR